LSDDPPATNLSSESKRPEKHTRAGMRHFKGPLQASPTWAPVGKYAGYQILGFICHRACTIDSCPGGPVFQMDWTVPGLASYYRYGRKSRQLRF
jgi:hypothetical protein